MSKEEKIPHKVDRSKPVYTKVCKKCSDTYETNSRGSRYCSDLCGKIYRRATKKRREEYAEHSQEAIIKVGSHKTARLVAELHHVKECVQCQTEELLEVHHKDGNYLNNSPDNLEFRCKEHHAEADSARKKASKGESNDSDSS